MNVHRGWLVVVAAVVVGCVGCTSDIGRYMDAKELHSALRDDAERDNQLLNEMIDVVAKRTVLLENAKRRGDQRSAAEIEGSLKTDRALLQRCQEEAKNSALRLKWATLRLREAAAKLDTSDAETGNA
jgi:hypothetical protein